MLHIVLCCASGMSTSLLVEKMKKAAKDQRILVDIWAVGANDIKENAKKADIILLGPQVKYAQKRIIEESEGKPVENIGMREYGMMNGAAVLQQVLAILEKK